MKTLFSLVLLTVTLLTAGCAGARTKVYAADLKHPVSLSKALYTQSGALVIPEQSSYVGHFQEKFSAWSILWTTVALSGDRDISPELTEQIEAFNGDGIVNLKVHASEDRFFALTSMIPIMPHAVHYRIEGDVVVLQ